MSILTAENKEITQWALQTALNYGCQEVRVTFVSGTDNSFEYRDLQLDTLESSTENQLYIEIFVDNKYGSFSSNRLDKNELDKFIKGAVESTRYLAEDIHRCLPDSDRYYRGTTDLNVFDDSYYQIPADEKLRVTQNAVREIYGTREDIISISASYNDSLSSVYMIASNGLNVQTDRTSYSLVVSVTLETATESRSEAYWYDVATHWDVLQKEGLGKVALQRALDKVGQGKIPSGNYEMLLDNMTVSRLLSPVMSSLYGGAIQQKNSFLIDKIGEKVFSDKLTIVDKPHQQKVIGSRLYDGEGIATKDMTIVEKGVLISYFIDTYYSNKMKIEPTIASSSGLSIELGNKNHEELIKGIKKGIWVTDFNGGNSNPTTGDFSFGVEGFLIEEGQIVKPVSEMNITGNLLDLWSNVVAVGNNPRKNVATKLPSILFKNVSFSGL